jgi:alkanesulfonate monooxygenase SsuD/methylene tetrahydromethanopterin reductase-like flavin-dependent oxidoreductase (luciferase family)
MKRPTFGVLIPTYGGHHNCPLYEKIDWNLTRGIVKRCEQLGYDSVWVPDHMMLGRNQAILDGWTVLSAFSAATEKIKLGMMVSCNSYRNPALAAKMGATLDVISGGRLIFGYGAGWKKDEYDAYGIPFPSPLVRVRQMREGLKIVERLWTEKEVTFQGEYYRIQGAVCEPKPLQKPRPPILVGAQKPLMLRLAAELADIWDIDVDPAVQTYKEKLEILKRHCSELQRPFQDLKKSVAFHILIAPTNLRLKETWRSIENELGEPYSMPREWQRAHAYEETGKIISGTPDECLKMLQEFVDLGVSQFNLAFLDYPDLRGIKVFAEEVMPRF